MSAEPEIERVDKPRRIGLRVNIAVAAMKAILSNPSCFRGEYGPTDQKFVHDVVKDSFAFADEILRRHFATRPEREERSEQPWMPPGQTYDTDTTWKGRARRTDF
jgi:hypothetical protein